MSPLAPHWGLDIIAGGGGGWGAYESHLCVSEVVVVGGGLSLICRTEEINGRSRGAPATIPLQISRDKFTP